MREAWLFRYQLQFETPFNFNGQQLAVREGLIVRLQEEGAEGFGEVAPLPGFSKESLPQAQLQLVELIKAWREGVPEPAARGDVEVNSGQSPAVAFGWSVALQELQQSPLKLKQPLVSALLLSAPLDDLSAQIEAMGTEFPEPLIVKVKVGRCSLAEDIQRLELIMQRLPGARLRLDGNRSWHVADVLELNHALPNLPVQFLEEPLQDASKLPEMVRLTGWGYALDESLHEPCFQLEVTPGLEALVLKPSLYGSLERCGELVQTAQRLKIPLIVSSSFESSLGITQLMALAECWSPDSVAGLDTLKYFQAIAGGREQLRPSCEVVTPQITLLQHWSAR